MKKNKKKLAYILELHSFINYHSPFRHQLTEDKYIRRVAVSTDLLPPLLDTHTSDLLTAPLESDVAHGFKGNVTHTAAASNAYLYAVTR